MTPNSQPSSTSSMTGPGTSGAKGELQRIRDRAGELRSNRAAGVQVATYLSGQIDDLIVRLVEQRLGALDEKTRQRLQHNSCIIAVGGTGRGDLAPYSDADLLFLYQRSVTKEFSELTSNVVRDCWDSGLKLGQSLHTIADAISTAKREIQFATALVESRLLWGSTEFFARFQRKVGRGVYASRLKVFTHECLEGRNAEQKEQGSTTKQLEPDLKRSLGGLRDLHFIRWIGFAHYGIRDIDGLRSRGILNTHDARALTEAYEFLVGVRTDMHLSGGRAADVLTRDEQLNITRARGIQGSQGQRDVERFMQSYFQHTAAVAEISERFARRHLRGTLGQRALAKLTARHIDGYFLRSRLGIDVDPSHREHVCSSLERLLELYHHCLVYDLAPVPDLVESIREAVPNIEPDMTHAGGRMFRSLLREPGNLGRVLRSMYHTGVLELVIPDMAHARGLLQFNQYHHYTVDEHTFRAIEACRNFETDPGPVGSAYRNAKHKGTLNLAILLHDIGKGYEEAHSDVGARIARRIAEDWQMSKNKADMLVFLVHKHLKMSHLALRRDTTDVNLLVEFAHEVGRPELLRMLYVLTAADIQAVGPGAWTDWKAGLLDELYNRAMLILSGCPVERLDEEFRNKVRNEVIKLITANRSRESEEVRSLLTLFDKFPTHYLVDEPAEDLVEDLQAVNGLEPNGLCVHGHYNDNGTAEYRVITSGNMAVGCFHRIAGALTANRMAIVTARICTTDDGVVVDSFTIVDDDFAGQIPEHRIESVCETLRAVLRDERSVADMFRSGQRYGAKPRSELFSNLVTRVVVDNDVSEKYTVIDVFAHNMPGLLFVVTRAIHRMKLSVALAKISTHFDQVLDVFYVSDLDGNKLSDDAAAAKVQSLLMDELNGFAEVQHSLENLPTN
jgi:[protein-PII] uridylyltransferase